MRNMRQILARHSDSVRKVVVPGGDHNLPSVKFRLISLLVASMHAKTAIAAFDSLDALAQSQFQRIVLRALAVIFERLGAGRLFRRTCQRQIAISSNSGVVKKTILTG